MAADAAPDQARACGHGAADFYLVGGAAAELSGRLRRRLACNTWSNPKHGHGASAGQFIKWHTIKDQPASVLHDVRRIREHPLVSKNIPIYGYVYDVYSGNLVEVAGATRAGQPR